MASVRRRLFEVAWMERAESPGAVLSRAATVMSTAAWTYDDGDQFSSIDGTSCAKSGAALSPRMRIDRFGSIKVSA
jgi:hypothetical protein